MALLRARDKALFQDEAESLKDTGDWKQLDLFSRGLISLYYYREIGQLGAMFFERNKKF